MSKLFIKYNNDYAIDKYGIKHPAKSFGMLVATMRNNYDTDTIVNIILDTGSQRTLLNINDTTNLCNLSATEIRNRYTSKKKVVKMVSHSNKVTEYVKVRFNNIILNNIRFKYFIGYVTLHKEDDEYVQESLLGLDFITQCNGVLHKHGIELNVDSVEFNFDNVIYTEPNKVNYNEQYTHNYNVTAIDNIDEDTTDYIDLI